MGEWLVTSCSKGYESTFVDLWVQFWVLEVFWSLNGLDLSISIKHYGIRSYC